METNLTNFEFYARRSNLTHRWSLNMRPKGGIVSADLFTGEVRGALGLSAREGERLGEAVRRLLLDHLREGSSVVLFDLVRVAPQLSPCLTEMATEEEALARLGAEGPLPVKAGLSATPRTQFVRQFARSMKGLTH